MNHFVYIIYSPAKDRFYVGESIDPIERLDQHNKGYYSGSSTKFTNDWEIFLIIECQSKSQALKVEKFIKRMRNREFYKRLRGSQKLVDEIVKKFS